MLSEAVNCGFLSLVGRRVIVVPAWHAFLGPFHRYRRGKAPEKGCVNWLSLVRCVESSIVALLSPAETAKVRLANGGGVVVGHRGCRIKGVKRVAAQ